MTYVYEISLREQYEDIDYVLQSIVHISVSVIRIHLL